MRLLPYQNWLTDQFIKLIFFVYGPQPLQIPNLGVIPESAILTKRQWLYPNFPRVCRKYSDMPDFCRRSTTATLFKIKPECSYPGQGITDWFTATSDQAFSIPLWLSCNCIRLDWLRFFTRLPPWWEWPATIEDPEFRICRQQKHHSHSGKRSTHPCFLAQPS